LIQDVTLVLFTIRFNFSMILRKVFCPYLLSKKE